MTRQTGVVVIDDSTLDKPFARQIELVSRHWSGKHHAVVQGINLVTLLWTDGERHIPCDYRLYAKGQDGLTKNDHFRHMLQTAPQRGFSPSVRPLRQLGTQTVPAVWTTSNGCAA